MKCVSKSKLLSITLSLAAFLVFFISFIRESSAQVNEHLNSPPPASYQQNQTVVPIHTNYSLPHPGILPTNPFYPIKMIRDRLALILTTNPNRRAATLLHYADKRIAAANALANKGETGAAISAAIKAEIYLSQAINESVNLNMVDRPQFFDQLKQAALKHEEIIEKLIQSTQNGAQNQAENLHHQLGLYRNQIVALSSEPFGYLRPEDYIKDATQDGASPSSSSSATPSATPTSSDEEPYL